MIMETTDAEIATICQEMSDAFAARNVLPGATCHVELLPDFGSFPESSDEVYRNSPAAYRPSADRMFVNGTMFFCLPVDVQAAVLAHETGHYADNHDPAIAASMSLKRHGCALADWLACTWGFADALIRDRAADTKLYGPKYAAVLGLWADPDAFTKAHTVWRHKLV